MKHGSYSKKIDFTKFAVKRFAPFMFSALRAFCGCGPTALGLLTGIDPLDIKSRDHWSATAMCRFLRERGFEIERLTRCNVTNADSLTAPLGKEHVLLLCIKMIKGEASWAVVYNNLIYHNLEVSPFKSYTLLNMPIMDAFIITHRFYRAKIRCPEEWSGDGFPRIRLE